MSYEYVNLYEQYLEEHGITDVSNCKIYVDENNRKHNPDGPAIINEDVISWYIHGTRHREDGPADLYKDGSYSYYQNGRLHREDGPAKMITTKSSDYQMFMYYVNGQNYRSGGPAIYTVSKNGEPVLSNSQRWFIKNNNPVGQFFDESIEITEEVFSWAEKNDVDLNNLTEDDIILIKMIWG